jgi:outer membrane lipoprotein-sorting protein
MFKVIIILLFFSFYIPANSSPKDKIISQMKLTDNLSFNFIQTIKDKNEDGKCIIEYPKKIFCEYINPAKKN